MPTNIICFLRRYSLLAFIGLVFSPLSVAHATDSVHSHAPFDYAQHQLNHPSPAAKRLATLERGQPRTVRLIYFLAKDRPFRAQVVQRMKDEIRKAQTFYAEQMQAHGHGNKTFRFETNAEGEPLVHRFDGQHPASYYIDETTGRQNVEYIPEIGRKFDFRANIYVIYRDIFDNDSGAHGRAEGKSGGRVSMPAGNSGNWKSWDWEFLAHELGHAFGLGHDFRDDKYIMSYGIREYPGESLSACAAEFLSVHSYFNSTIPTQEGTPPTIQLTSPTEYPASAQSVSIQIKVRDLDGIHQVILSAAADSGPAVTAILPAVSALSVKACRGLAGKKEAVVEFDYDGVFRRIDDRSTESSLADSPTHSIFVHVIDTNGNASSKSFGLTGIGSYDDEEEPFKRDYEIAPHHIVTVEGYTETVNQVVFSPDGTMIASAGRDGVEGGSIRLWDAKTLQNLATMRIGTVSDRPGVTAVAFSPDGTMIASGRAGGVGGGSVRLWDAKTGQLITTLIGHKFRITGLAFSPDGTMIASSGAEENAIRLWNVKTRKTIATLEGHKRELRGVAFSPDGTMIASSERDGYERDVTIRLWNVKTRKTIATLEAYIGTSYTRGITPFGLPLPGESQIAFSPDGSQIAFSPLGIPEIWLWDVKTQQLIATLKGHTHDIGAVAFSPDGTMIASAGLDRTIRLWNANTQQLITTFERHPDAIRTLAFSPDGTTIASGVRKGTIWLWNVPNGAVSTTEPEDTTPSEPEDTTPAEPEDTTPAEDVYSLTKSAGDNQQGPASTQLAKSFVVSVLDQNGSPLAGATVTFAVTAGGGMLSATTDANSCTVEPSTSVATATTNANGQASARLTLGSEPGTNAVEATVEGLEPVIFTATAAEQAMPHSLTKVCGDSQEGTAGVLLAEPFVVLVADEDGAAMAGVAVSFAATAGGGTLSATTATTDANGRAATSLTLGSETGTNAVEATVEGLESVTFTATGQEDPLVSLFDTFLGSGKRVALPDSPQLAQNHPNPFNPATTIRYALSHAADVELTVYNILGQPVHTLVAGHQSAGFYAVEWDATDASGQRLSSGMYFYRLQAGEEFREIKKMLLLR